MNGSVDIGEGKRSKIHHFLQITAFWIILLVIVDPFSDDALDQHGKIYENIGGTINRGVTVCFSAEHTVTQEFVPQQNRLKQIDILLATYARSNSALFSISLLEKGGKEICKEIVDSSMLQDNSYYTLSFSPQEDSKNKTYQLIIEGIDGNADNSPTGWVADACNDDISTVVDGVSTDYCLVMQMGYEGQWLYLACWCIVILSSYGLVLVARRTDEKSFVCICLCIGILFVFLNSFRNPIDEDTHFFKSYSISRLRTESIENGQIGSYLSSSLNDFLAFRRFGVNKNLHLFSQSFAEEEEFYRNPYASSIIPINHCIASIGLLIANAFHMSIGWTVIAGRLSNFVFYVLSCYFAIKNVHHYKSIFFTVACLPVAIWLATSYSTDPVLLSSSLVFLSICFKYRFDGKRRINRRDMILLPLCSMSIASVKYLGYAPLLLCFFMIPKECFAGKQRRNIVVAVVFILCMLMLWQVVLLKRFPYTEDRNGDTNVVRQIRFIMSNACFSVRNIMDYCVSNALWHLQNMYIYSTIPQASSLLSMVCILSAVIAGDKKVLPRHEAIKLQLVFASIFSFIALLIMVGLYVGFTPVGSYGIQGLQTRYYMPALVPLMTTFALSGVQNKSATHEQFLVYLVECALLLSLTGTLMNTFTS